MEPGAKTVRERQDPRVARDWPGTAPLSLYLSQGLSRLSLGMSYFGLPYSVVVASGSASQGPKDAFQERDWQKRYGLL